MRLLGENVNVRSGRENHFFFFFLLIRRGEGRETGRTGIVRRTERRVSGAQRRRVRGVQRHGGQARGSQQRRARRKSPDCRTRVRFGPTPRFLSIALHQLFGQVNTFIDCQGADWLGFWGAVPPLVACLRNIQTVRHVQPIRL